MRSLAHTSSDKDQTLSMAHVKSMVNERVQQALLSYSQGVQFAQGSMNAGSAGPSFPTGSISKASSARSNWKKNKGKGSRSKGSRGVSDLVGDDNPCFDCGQTSHKRVDRECPSPSFLTKKISREREAQVSSTNTRAPSQSGFFCPGPGQNTN